MEGIGIRSADQLAPSAYLASAAGCAGLVSSILPPLLQDTPNPWLSCAKAFWNQSHNQAPPPFPDSHHQRAWESPRTEGQYCSQLESSPNPNTCARLLATATKEARAWLNAFPISSISLRMNTEAIRIAVGLRLGLPLS